MHSGDQKGCDDFVRRVYFKKDSTFKLVQYLGDETKYVPCPHGNQKDPHGDYRRTLQSILRKMEKQTHTKNPMDTHREMRTTKTTGAYQGVSNPRNIYQVRNVASKSRQKKRIGQYLAVGNREGGPTLTLLMALSWREGSIIYMMV